MSEITPPALDAALAHTGFVQGLARALLGADGAVDDVVQETWLAAARGGPDDPARMRGWLGGVVRRLSAGVYRKRATERRLAPGVVVKPDAPSTQEVVAREEMRREVVVGMLELREPYRSALLLRYYEDLPPRAVAARLGVPVETARTRIKRGLEKLRLELDDRPGGRAAWAPAVGGLSGLAPGKAFGGVGSGLLAIAALVLVGLGAGLWWGLGGNGDEPVAPIADLADLTAGEETGDAADRGPTLEGNAAGIVPGARAVPSGTAGVMGFVRRGGMPQACTVSLWHIGSWDNDLDGRIEARRQEGVGLARAADRTAVSDSRGRFAFEGLGVGTYVLGVEATPGAFHTRLLSIETDGIIARGSLSLPAGNERLELQVTKADGSPYVGLVSLHRRDVEKGNAARTNLVSEADSSGRLTFTGLASGSVWLEILGEGTRTNATVVVPQSDVVKIVLGATTHAIEGQVLSHEGRTPVPGANIRMGSEGPRPEGVRRQWENWTAIADEDGRFQIAYAPGREAVHVVVTAPGHARLVHRLEEGDGAEPLTLLLFPDTSITGEVRSSTGAPVAGVAVVARRVDGYGRPRLGHTQPGKATSDRTGRFTLAGLQAGTYVLYARGEGWSSPHVGRARLGGFNPYLVHVPSTGLRDQLLTVARTIPCRGRVVDQHGEPIAGASVQAQLPRDRRRDLPPPFLLGSTTVTTDGSGMFTLHDLVPGLAWRAHVSGPHVASAVSVPLVLREDAKLLTIEAMRLDPSRDLVVHVLDEKDDSPIEGVRIYLMAPYDGGSSSISGLGGTTGANGRVFINPVPSGPASIHLSGAVIERPRRATPVPEGRDQRVEVTLRVPRRFMITGTLELVPDGMPRFGFSGFVKAVPVGGSLRDSVYGNMEHDTGAWSVGPLTKGKWRVTVSEGMREVSGVFEAGETDAKLELTYPWKSQQSDESGAEPTPRERVEYRVVGPDGTPVPVVTATKWGGRSGGGGKRPGTGWSEVLRGRTAGHGLEIIHPRTDRGDVLPLGAVVLPPAVRRGEVVIRMEPELTIAGRVRIGGELAPAGVPVVARASMMVEGEQWISRSSHALSMTDAEGRFRLRGLGPYAYHLDVKGEALLPKAEPNIVQAGTEDVGLDYEAAATATITLAREDGSTLPGMRVRVIRAERRADHFGDDVQRTNARGAVTFTGLDPSVAYQLKVWASPETHKVVGVSRTDWHPKNETIRLPAVQSVSGTVVDMQGVPIPDIRIRGNVPGQSENYWANYTRADEEGRFKILGVPPDGVRIAAQGTYYKSDPVTAIPGDDGVVLRLRRGIGFRVELDAQPGTNLRSVAFHWAATDRDGRRTQSFRSDATQARKGWFALQGQAVDAKWNLYWRGLPDGRIGWLGAVELGDGETVRVPVVAGETLRGRFDLPEGVAGTDLRVVVKVLGARWRVPVAADGTFEIEGLPPIDVELRPERNVRPNSTQSGSSVTVKPGASPVLRVPGS